MSEQEIEIYEKYKNVIDLLTAFTVEDIMQITGTAISLRTEQEQAEAA
jgi:hypothetical protein